jgi:phosphatidylglycerol lysyltransferase
VTDDSRQRALALIQKYGWNNTSFQTLEPYFEYWFDPNGSGVVAYYQAWGTWVVAGAPICPLESIVDCALSFAAAAKRAGYRVCFFGTAGRFAHQFNTHATHVKIGEQPCWDPALWDSDAKRTQVIGSQRRRAQRKGVTVTQVSPQVMARTDSLQRQQAERVITQWQKAQRMATMSFLVHLDAFSFANERRYFLAVRHAASGNAEPVGFLSLVPIYARDGFFLEDLIRIPTAPNGTAEALIDAAMRSIATEDKHYATLGLTPLRNTRQSQYRQPGWARAIFGLSRRAFDPLYHFHGLEAFKAKLRPDHWEEIYVTGIPRFNFNMLIAILMAFARSHPTRFALDTLVRLITTNVRRIPQLAFKRMTYALAITLIVWVGVLSQCNGPFWFGSQTMLRFWITFDMVMVVVLFCIGYCISQRTAFVRWLSWLALLFVVGDLTLTLYQAIAFFMREPANWLTASAWLLAISGPAIATLFLSSLLIANPRRTR